MTDPKARTAVADLAAAPWKVLPLLVAMNGIAPVSLYMLVPTLPLLATTFQQDISVAQMTVSLTLANQRQPLVLGQNLDTELLRFGEFRTRSWPRDHKIGFL